MTSDTSHSFSSSFCIPCSHRSHSCKTYFRLSWSLPCYHYSWLCVKPGLRSNKSKIFAFGRSKNNKRSKVPYDESLTLCLQLRDLSFSCPPKKSLVAAVYPRSLLSTIFDTWPVCPSSVLFSFFVIPVIEVLLIWMSLEKQNPLVIHDVYHVRHDFSYCCCVWMIFCILRLRWR